MFLLNGQPIALDVPFTHNEIQYPANWIRLASTEERAAIGITEAPDPEVYDDRLYWSAGNPKNLEDTYVDVEVDGEMVPTVQSRGLKYQWVLQVKDTANKLMQPTDWLVLRQLFKGIGMSAIVENYRDAVVAESNRLEEAINACTTVEELASIQFNWPQQGA